VKISAVAFCFCVVFLFYVQIAKLQDLRKIKALNVMRATMDPYDIGS